MKGAEEEAERQLEVVKKLKAEVTRKEGMLKATQSELDKVYLPTWADVIISCCCRLCRLVTSCEGLLYDSQYIGVSVL